MQALEFITKLDEIYGEKVAFEIDNPFMDFSDNYKIYMEFTPDDFSLYVQVEYNNHIYYYHFNNAFTECAEFDSDLPKTRLELPEDMLNKINSLVHNLPFDDRIVVPLDLSEDDLFKLMKLAHEKDMTLNKFIELLISQLINDDDFISDFKEKYKNNKL